MIVLTEDQMGVVLKDLMHHVPKSLQMQSAPNGGDKGYSSLSEGLGVLSAHHAEQVNEGCKYGTERTLEYVRYLISNGFPTGTVFTDAGELVAYILCRTDGCMFNGFVRPNHRRKGLYQVVNYDLAGKVVALGQPTAWYTF
ncbi:hypothetical protein RvY_07941 [Ramazzottius varieornatus]|uniref:Glycine N-acyltransferase-like protein n=1 Tax=Ramazzottius varieornatus TaxID=947166 RepID=A0A1D1V421_RAMVA|nr:hypothetical protein RvY_07941 [Ramazzottius varieornatus]